MSILTRLVLITATILSIFAAESAFAPQRLRVEYMESPMTVDAAPPRLSWVPAVTARGVKQVAYQIQVSKSAAMTAGEVWDSGRVEGAGFVNVDYAGKGLESGRTYYWRIRTWDSAGNQSPFSAPARFGTGLFNASDWKGNWISGGGLLRKELDLSARVVSAKIFVAAAGYYELRVNGHKVGDHVLDPANTPYAKRILYEAYDVTHCLRQGANAIGVMLGQGWFKGRVARLQINVELEGGKSIEFHTDSTWRAGKSPIVEDSIFDGESYDATLEQPGWDCSGFAATGWTAAQVVKSPTAALSGQSMPPIRVTGTITPFVMTNPKPGVYVYDMGQNFSGWVRLAVRGPRGARVRLRHAELLYGNGMLNVENLRGARATDVYVLKGEGEEVWEPRFTYHGFRYVEVTGYPGVPPANAITGRIVHSDVAPHGGFSSSKPVLNQIQRMVQWGIRSNLHSVPTDCSQRDERMGWMADAHLVAETAMLNYDMAAFYTTWLRSIRDEQADDGSVPDTVPRAHFAVGPSDPAWGAAYPIILWDMWRQYGDRRILEQHFEGIKKYSDWLWAKSENGILTFVKFGDWVPVDKTPGDLVSTAYSFWSANIAADVAKALGKSTDEQAYRQRAETIKAAFHAKFFNAETDSYGNGSQTSSILPLYLNMVPKDKRGVVAGNFRDAVVYKYDSHLTTGIHGTKYLMELLARQQADLAYDIAVNADYPGWGYMAANGATTFWELWQKKEGPSMNSHNHPTLGSIGAYFMKELAGISVKQGGEGYKQILIRPQVIRDLQYAEGSFQTLPGLVSSAWKREDGKLTLNVTIPFGSEAEVRIPKLRMRDAELLESGKTIWRGKASATKAEGVFSISEDGGAVTVLCGGGSYSFELKGW